MVEEHKHFIVTVFYNYLSKKILRISLQLTCRHDGKVCNTDTYHPVTA